MNPEEIAAAAAAAEAAAQARIETEAAAATKAAADAAAKIIADKAAADLALANQTEEQKLLREVMDRKAKQKAAEAEAADLKAKLAAFEGVDVEKFKTMMKAESDAVMADAEKKGEFDRVKAAMISIHEAEKAELVKQMNEEKAARAAAAVTIDELTIGSSFAGSDYIRTDMLLSPAKARHLFGGHFDIKDGVLIAFDKPAGSVARTPLEDAKGVALSFEDAIKKIIDKDPDRDTLLRTKVNPGPGSKTTVAKVTQKASGLFGTSRILAGLNKNK
ncbi:MAG: DUF6651 domain-containing protein [Undibacterium sp.]